jgi:hypothetical protein
VLCSSLLSIASQMRYDKRVSKAVLLEMWGGVFLRLSAALLLPALLL